MRISKSKYRQYIKSSEWADVRKRYFKSKLWKKVCYCCGKKDVRVDLHHKTYKRLGYEKLCDLIAICRNCHNKTHELVKIGHSLYNAAKRIRQVESKGRPWKQAVEIALNHKKSKERKKAKIEQNKKWFKGLGKRDANLLKMELSLRMRGIKY